MEKIIEGKIEYESKKYGFYYLPEEDNSFAFESWFDINFPKFKSDTNENYKILKDKVIKFIDDCIDEEDEK